MKKVLCLILAFSMVFAAACDNGGKNPGNTPGGDDRGEATKIVIYNGGSSEFSIVKGSDEDTAINAIEDKYFEDTGVNLDFEVNYLGTSMKSKLSTSLSGGDQVDIVVSHTRGGEGLDEYVLANNCYYDIADLLEDYGGNILDSLSDNALSAVTTYDKKVIGIPSVVSPYKFGILVRKDYMEACGFTDDPTDTSKTFVGDMATFEKMLVAMKAHIEQVVGDCTHVVSGAIWDLEKVLVLGPYADAGYWSYTEQYDENGDYESVLPGFATDEYEDVLKLEYKWVKNGLVSTSANNMSLELFESEFIAGKTGVFVCDPTVQHLIQVSRKVKSYNASAEFAVLGALPADGTSAKKGFMKNSEATFVACIMKNSANAKEIIKFYNWMYSKPENYELCTYGIEGTHWVKNEDGTYSYPNEQYMTKKPYSGAIALVENQQISDLTYAGYTEEEKSWIATAADEDNYINNDTVNFLLPYNSQLNENYKSAANPFYGEFATKVWYGELDPDTVYDSSSGIKFFPYYQSMFLSVAESYINTVSQYYQILNPAVNGK